MKAARYHRTGPPSEVVVCEEVPSTAPGPGEVGVRMACAIINPADLNMLEGRYGEARPLPDVPGNCGCGWVSATGEGVEPALLGRMVLVDSQAWCSAGVWPAADLVVLPDGLDPVHAAALRVNPPTAWRMLEDFVDLQPGDWIVQNAATSAVGRAVVEIARLRGWRTINLVRRIETAADLRAAGAEVVVLDDDEAAARIREAAPEARPRLGLNAVGGASATRVAGLLAPGGTMVTYGAMGKEAVKLPNSFLIFRRLVVTGFWLTLWLREAPAEAREGMFATLSQLAGRGLFRPQVAAEFRLPDVTSAVAAAMAGPQGKVVLRLD